MIRRNLTFRPQLVRAGRLAFVGLGVWAGLVLLVTTLFTLSGAFPLGDALYVASWFWMGWFLCAPIAVIIGYETPLDKSRIWLGGFILALGACAIVLINQFAAKQFLKSVQGIAFPELRERQLPRDVFRDFINRPERPSRSNGPPRGRPPREFRQDRRPPPGAPHRFLGLRIAMTSEGPRAIRFARLSLDLLLYGLICSISQAFRWSRRAQDRERLTIQMESELKSAQLATLQTQLNPHFLFNTLNSVATLIHIDPNSADRMLNDLSGLLRETLDTLQEPEIALRREIEFVSKYLAIEQTRFGDRLTSSLDISPDTLDALVPTFMLQPIVENCVRHGIEPQTSPGNISITSALNDAKLTIQVEDTGAGLPNPEARQHGSGLGLKNTRDRLERLYPDAFDLLITPRRPNGFLVTIVIPFHTERRQLNPSSN